jgi:hypothetical protein
VEVADSSGAAADGRPEQRACMQSRTECPCSPPSLPQAHLDNWQPAKWSLVGALSTAPPERGKARRGPNRKQSPAAKAVGAPKARKQSTKRVARAVAKGGLQAAAAEAAAEAAGEGPAAAREAAGQGPAAAEGEQAGSAALARRRGRAPAQPAAAPTRQSTRATKGQTARWTAFVEDSQGEET